MHNPDKKSSLKTRFKNTLFYKLIAESYHHFAKPSFVLRTAIIDIIFFIAFSLTYTFFSLKIVDVINSINSLVSEMNVNVSGEGIPGSETIAALSLQKDSFMQQFSHILILILMLASAVYLLWCIFQGTSWWLTHRHVGKKVPFMHYIGKFSLFSLVWIILFVIFTSLITKISGIFTIGSVELMSTDTMISLIVIFSFVLLYFAFISFALLHKGLIEIIKGAFHIGVKKALITVPIFFYIILKTYILFKLLILLGLDVFWTVILGVIVFVPVLIWSRILINIAAHRLHKTKG
jgi:hypothetical protein